MGTVWPPPDPTEGPTIQCLVPGPPQPTVGAALSPHSPWAPPTAHLSPCGDLLGDHAQGPLPRLLSLKARLAAISKETCQDPEYSRRGLGSPGLGSRGRRRFAGNAISPSDAARWGEGLQACLSPLHKMILTKGSTQAVEGEEGAFCQTRLPGRPRDGPLERAATSALAPAARLPHAPSRAKTGSGGGFGRNGRARRGLSHGLGARKPWGESVPKFPAAVQTKPGQREVKRTAGGGAWAAGTARPARPLGGLSGCPRARTRRGSLEARLWPWLRAGKQGWPHPQPRPRVPITPSRVLRALSAPARLCTATARNRRLPRTTPRPGTQH